MAIEKVYSLKIEGADSVNDLRSAIEQLNDKLQTLNQTSKEYKATLEELTKLQGQLSDAMKGISDAAGSTNESIDGIKESLNEMGEVINTVGGEVIDSFVNGVVEGMTEAASSITVVNTNLQDLSQIDSVKDLKGHISDLRDKLVTLENGSDDYKATVQELINAQVKLKEVMNAGKNEMEAAEGSYNALSQRMSALKQVWKETTDEATRNEIGQQINEINNQLKALDASIGNSQRNVGNYKSALEGLDESFVGWKEELKQCKEALQQLDPSTQAYADTMARAAELTHNITEQQEMLKNASNDVGDVLTNVQGVGTNLAAGFSALNAAMGLFGEENEEVQQAMLKVQQAMALVQGMQGMDGFWKNTKKLSTQMGLATKETNKNTAATKANANASKQDALSKKAEGAATESVIPAQKGLNAAMKANPIGFIIGLIASLIAIFTLLKDKIMEMIGSNKEMSAAFDKVKAVLAGFGNVIKKSIINPIKLAIIPIKTLAKVMIDVFKGDWSKIGDDIKEGFEETKNTVVDTINVVGAFKEGYDKKTAEQNEAARKAEAAAREKELDNIIKDNEAKYGSDWKYTEEAKKLYEEMFKVRMAQYKEDSDEYREAQRDKMAYDRELAEKQQEEEDKKKAEQDKKNKEAANKAEDERKKRLSDFKSTFEKYMPNWNKYEIDINNMYEKWTNGVEEFAKELLVTFIKNGESIEKAAEKTTNMINLIYKNFKKTIWNDMYGKEWNAELERTFYNMDRTTKAYLNKRNQLYQEDKIKFGIEFPTDELSNFYAIYNMTKKNIEKEQKELESYIDKFYKDALTDAQVLQGLVFDESDELGKHLKETIDYYLEVYNMYANELAKGNYELAEQYRQVFDENINRVIGPEFGNREALEEALGVYLSEFQKMLDKRNQLSMEYSKNDLEYFTKSADVYAKVYERVIDDYKVRYEILSAQRDELFEQDFNNAMRWQGVYDNEIRDLYERDEHLTESYNLQLGYYKSLWEYYNEMSNDTDLTFEQREQAKQEAIKVTNDMLKLQWEEETRQFKLQKELIKQWSNAFKDATSGMANILGTIGDSWSSLIELEKNEIAQQLENGEISEKEAKRREKENERAFENLKAIQIAQAIINTLSAAVGAYQSMASIPYVGPVLGAAAAAAALAAGYAQVRQIQATTYESGSSSDGSGGGSTNFQLPSVMELEPDLQGRMTGMSDTDELNNSGGRGRGETAVRAWVVESDITASQELANKRHQEVTF